jgi:uroporphyrinogen-III decarboxylase
MINKIITFPIEQIRGDDINLIFSIIQNIKNENDYRKSLNTAFDYVYKYIINDISKGKNFISDFTRTIASLKHDDHSFFSSYYIEKIINELLVEKDWKKIELVTPADKEKNINFYTKKCGFKIVSEELDRTIRVFHFSLDKE